MNRGEVWLVNLDPTLGSEIRKTRPAIIVSDERLGILPLRVIVPVTSWKPHYRRIRWMVNPPPGREIGLVKESSADAFQVRSISVQRLTKRIGIVPESVVEKIERALSVVLKIRHAA